MKPRLFVLAAALSMGACAIQPSLNEAGVGQNTRGEPVTGLFVFSGQTKIFNISIDSPKGWSCRSTFEQSTPAQPRRQEPLICNDGRSGTAIYTINRDQGQIVASFRLTDGESGQVTFGRL